MRLPRDLTRQLEQRQIRGFCVSMYMLLVFYINYLIKQRPVSC